MIKKIITPEHRDISLRLPESFVGKQVEIIAFAIDETTVLSMVKDEPQTHYASQKTLSKEWNNPEEDKAWEHL